MSDSPQLFFPGPGELRELMRSHDWSSSELGAPQEWPDALFTLAAVMLDLPQPALLTWGSTQAMLYNDAMAAHLGAGHPSMLGRPLVHAAAVIDARLRMGIEAALSGEQVAVDVAQRGASSASPPSFRFSCAPMRDRQGQVLGVFTTGVEASAGLVAEDRVAFQLALADALRPLTSATDVVATASEMLGRRLGLSRVVYAEILQGQGRFVLRHEWTGPGTPRIAETTLPLGDFGPDIVALLREGRPMLVHDVRKDPRTVCYAANYAALQVGANLALPLVRPDGLVVILSVHAKEPREWSEADVQIVHDVAERTWLAVQAASVESALHETKSWLSAVFDTLPVGVGVFDAQGTVLLANQAMRRYMPNNTLPSRDLARRTRWHATDADGRLVAPDDFPGRRALRGERVVPGIEALFEDDQGREVWTQVAAVPVRDQDGRVTGIVTVVHEIDTLKRAESAQRVLVRDLAEANRRQTEFLAVLAHELRNPLAPILTALELLRVPDDAEIAVRVREVLQRQTRQMAHLIDDLLDVARVSSGRIEIRRDLVDLQAAIATAVETSLPVIEASGHDLRVQLHEGALPVLADPTRLAQIVANLLTNAAKYTPRGGRILLTVAKEGHDAVVTVRDNGIGIPSGSLRTVFGMFSQLNAEGGAAPGGLGIGLALVQQLVALHGGSVTAESEGPGQGSTFVVRLPLADATEAADGPAQPLRQHGGRALRILVADDNVDAAESLAALLEVGGHATQVAFDGREAMRLAAQARPDVAFLDIGMPGMSGYEVARQMRADPALEGITLVALTGWGTEEDRARAREAGFDTHFTKPVSPEDLGAFLDAMRR